MISHAANAVPKLTGRQVLLGLIAFFLLVAAANAAFIYVALSTYAGVVAIEPYRKGLKYNERIAADEQQKARGWKDEIALGAGRDRLTVSLHDEDGSPVTSLTIFGKIGRPATEAVDHPIELKETEPGRYEVSLASALEPGSWIVDLTASQGGVAESEILYRLRERLWLKP